MMGTGDTDKTEQNKTVVDADVGTTSALRVGAADTNTKQRAESAAFRRRTMDSMCNYLTPPG